MNVIKNFPVALLLLSLSSSLAALSPNQAAANVLAQAHDVIAAMVRSNSRLTPEFLRLGFHDCVGGCDGCIDLADSSNNGLAHPIAVLEPVVAQFADGKTGVTRADIWALAAMVGADAADHGHAEPISFTQNWYGRQTCEQANTVCQNAAGSVVACSATAGPARSLPPPTLNSSGVFAFFANNFGFNERQTVAIMGAHTVGRALKNESGIDGPSGWTINNVVLQNEYYQALMGSVTSSTFSDSTIEGNAPNWLKHYQINTGLGTPNRNYWTLGVNGTSVIMLDVDIALVRDLNANNTDVDGKVSCNFKSSGSCSLISTWKDAADFAGSNNLWLSEFRSAMDIMLTNGYLRNQCGDEACPLTTNRLSHSEDTTAPSSTPIQFVYTPQPVGPTAPTADTTHAPTAAPVQFLYSPHPATPRTKAPTATPILFLYNPQPASTRTKAPSAMPIQFLYSPQPAASTTMPPTATPFRFLYSPQPASTRTKAPSAMPIQFLYSPQPADSRTKPPTATPIQFLYSPQPASTRTKVPSAMPIQFLYSPQPATTRTKAPSTPPIQFLYSPQPIQSTPNILFVPSTMPGNSKVLSTPTQEPAEGHPTNRPTPSPTARPTKPTTPQPTKFPTPPPSIRPTKSPTPQPTELPTPPPTTRPTKQPTPHPSKLPTPPPTTRPTNLRTPLPTKLPTPQPTARPTKPPTPHPTRSPSPPPTPRPTHCVGAWYDCSHSPDACCDGLTCVGLDLRKSCRPLTPSPTRKPTKGPTAEPTHKTTEPPTTNPTEIPTVQPTSKPTKSPTPKPTKSPTAAPTPKPTKSPTRKPSMLPTHKPTKLPTASPTPKPTKSPTALPTFKPTKLPTTKPTKRPTDSPTATPTRLPTPQPTTTTTKMTDS